MDKVHDFHEGDIVRLRSSNDKELVVENAGNQYSDTRSITCVWLTRDYYPVRSEFLPSSLRKVY